MHSYNCFNMLRSFVAAGGAFHFFQFVLIGEKWKACHILLVTVFAGRVVRIYGRVFFNCAAGITRCKNCASLRSSGTQNVTKIRRWVQRAKLIFQNIIFCFVFLFVDFVCICKHLGICYVKEWSCDHYSGWAVFVFLVAVRMNRSYIRLLYIHLMFYTGVFWVIKNWSLVGIFLNVFSRNYYFTCSKCFCKRMFV